MGRTLDQADVGPLGYSTLLLHSGRGKRLRMKGAKSVNPARYSD